MEKGTLLYQVTTIKSHERSSAHFLTSNITRLTFQNRPIALITLVEINDPWNPAREAGQAILDSVSREFIKSAGNSLLIRFEQVLKTTNSVVERAQEKIDKFINVAVIIVDGQQVHFSTIGNTKIILHRSSRLADVSSEQSDSSTRFSAVTSGDLTTKDTLFVATHDLAKLIKQAGKDGWQDEMTSYLDALLTDSSPEDLSLIEGYALRYSPENPSSEVYLAGEKKKAHLPEMKVAFPAVNFGGLLKKATAQTKKIHFRLPETAIPKLEHQPKLPKMPRLPKNLGFIKTILTSKLTYLAIMIAIVGFSVYTFISHTKNDQTEIKTPTAVDTINAQTSSTIAAYLNSETTLPGYNNLSDADKTLFVNKLTEFGYSVLTSELKSELSNEIVQINTLGTDVYLLDNTGQLYRWNGSVMAQIQQTSRIVNAVSFAVFAVDKIVVSDQSGGIWLLDGTVLSPKSLTVPTNIPSGQRVLSKYSTNLYIFASSGAVYRFNNFTTELTAPSLVTKAGILPFTGLKDWAINGDFVAISEAGLVQTWSKNTLGTTPFSLTDLGDKAALAVDTTKNTYIATKQLLRMYALGNTLSKTYYLAEKNPATDIAQDESGNWYLASGNRLLLIKP